MLCSVALLFATAAMLLHAVIRLAGLEDYIIGCNAVDQKMLWSIVSTSLMSPSVEGVN